MERGSGMSPLVNRSAPRGPASGSPASASPLSSSACRQQGPHRCKEQAPGRTPARSPQSPLPTQELRAPSCRSRFCCCC